MRLYTQGTQRIHIDPGNTSSTGYIGIGNSFTDPKSRLHIHEGNNQNVQLQLTTTSTDNSSASQGFGIGIIDGNSNAELKNYENADILFYTTNSTPSTLERVRIKSTGDVGIGIASPLARLHIVAEIPGGTIASTRGAFVEADGNSYASQVTGISILAKNAISGGGSTLGINIETVATDVNSTGMFAEASCSKAGANPTAGASGGTFSAFAGNADGAVICIGVAGLSTSGSHYINGPSYGGYFDASGSNTTCIGVYGNAQHATSNYGVFGQTTSNSGCVPGSGTCSNAAGYFNGNLIYTGAFGALSDLKFKNNINPIDSSVYFLNHIQPHSFYFDTTNYPQMNLPFGKHYGVVAQELEVILPGLVNNYVHPMVKDSAGVIIHPAVNFKAVNYIELISILVAGYQNQQMRIDSLVGVIGNIPKAGNPGNGNENQTQGQRVSLSNGSEAILYQNQPNPFKGSTKINYYIPENTTKAEMNFYDATGMVLKSISISEKGQGSVEVDAENLRSAIYTYSLTVDGKLIDTKRMVKMK